MCKCTPNIRTPFCGRPGCQWPEPKPESQDDSVGPIRINRSNSERRIDDAVDCIIDHYDEWSAFAQQEAQQAQDDEAGTEALASQLRTVIHGMVFDADETEAKPKGGRLNMESVFGRVRLTVSDGESTAAILITPTGVRHMIEELTKVAEAAESSGEG